MTREEALEELHNSYSEVYPYGFDAVPVIHKIYDAFESHTCENCKYCDDSYFGAASGQIYKCEFGIGTINEYGTIYTERDFGCNKWEKKS